MAPKKEQPERPSLQLAQKQRADFDKVCKSYHAFLSLSRTPYETVNTVVQRAQKAGIKQHTARLTTKDKGFYMTNADGTNAAVVRFGKEPISSGVHIIAAHVDSPCLTAKTSPVRQKPEGVVLDCHPYGGISLHQWFDTDVTVLGHCIKKGKTITFTLPGVISDATIHLSAADRHQKKYDDAFVGEALDVFIGFKDKKEFLDYMKKQHGIEEEDFARTMLTVVPNSSPRKISSWYYTGFGQDDKVCSFAQLEALLQANVEKTAIVLFFDREEIGSTGYNGALSKFLEYVLDAVVSCTGKEMSDMMLRKMLASSLMVSADVDVAYNSNDTAYSDEESATKFGDGLVMDRNNGGRNQSYGNNVPMHMVDMYMELFAKHKVQFKVSSIPPKVNTGGGGTIAMYFAHRGIPVVDMGIATMSMHGKHPVIFLPDMYHMVKGFQVFLESKL